MNATTRNTFNETDTQRIARRKAIVRQAQEAASIMATFERRSAQSA